MSRLSPLLTLAEARPLPVLDFRESVRDVILLASSSRGGSSVFAEILRHAEGLLHFHAEINPFLRLAGLGFPDSGTDSDTLDARHAASGQLLGDLFARDAGRPLFEDASADWVPALLEEARWRLSLQWPECRFEPEVLDEALSRMAEALAAGGRPDPARVPGCFVDLLLDLRARGLPVDPGCYDIDASLLPAELALPLGPPSETLVEEPPFVVVHPWLPADAASLATRPLLVKTPSNAYRLPFLRALFPRARLRVLHLCRNAAASINGLYDGWRYRGFFSHRLDEPLDIAGYSDVFPEWGRRWWKFDLPPGWRAWTRRPLVEVCAFQWRSAHEAILAGKGLCDDYLAVRFEDAVGPLAARRALFERVSDWMGVPLESRLLGVLERGLPPIMATARPRHRRWYEKAELLEPVLGSSEIRDTMERLGYEDDPRHWT